MQSQIDALTNSISQAQQTLRRLENIGGGSGSASILGGNTRTATNVAVPGTRGGVNIPFVTNVQSALSGTTAGHANVLVTWNDAPDPTGIIDSYNIWITGSILGQAQETLATSSHLSPAVFTVPNSKAGTVSITVQTVLKNGYTNPLPSCPTTAINVPAPVIDAASLNINGLFFGPNGTLTLSGFTFSNGPGTNISWSAGLVSYKGISYTVAAGSGGSGASFMIAWQLASPTVFSNFSSTATLGLDDFVVLTDTSSGAGAAQPFYSTVVEIHNSAGQRLVLDGSTAVTGWNAEGKNVYSLARTAADSVGVPASGVLRLFDGTQTGRLGGGQTVIILAGATTFIQLALSPAPGANAGGGSLYVAGTGALHYVGAAGTDTLIAPA